MQYLSGIKQTGLAISISGTLLVSGHAIAQTSDSVLDTVVVQGQNQATDTLVGDAKQEKAPESKPHSPRPNCKSLSAWTVRSPER